jgi:hypothetical protein
MRKPDDTRTLTLDEARALPGMLGRIAPLMLAAHGRYGYRDAATGRTVLLVVR